MSMDHEKVLKTKLHQLECHFNWALIKDELDLPSVLNRLHEQLDWDVGKKDRLARTHNALAYVKFLQGYHEEALSTFKRSAQLYIESNEEENDKTLIVTYGNLAWLHYHMKNYTECESYLQKLQKINENISSEFSSVPAVLGEKGWTFLQHFCKDYEGAKECFKKALELQPENSSWNAGYAITLYRTEHEDFSNDNSPTVQQLRRAIETNPNDDVLKVFLAQRLVKCKRQEEAERFVEEALKGSPDHSQVLRYAGKYFKEKGCVDRGIGLLIKALERSPNSHFIHHQLALCYKIQKIQLLKEGYHPATASRVQQICDMIMYHLQRATTLKTGFITAMRELALHYGEQLDTSRAEELFQETFEKAKEKNDGLYVVNFYYAEFQLYYNRCEDLAIKHYMECLKLHSKSPEGNKSEFKLRKIAEKRMNKNSQVGEAYGILGFLHKQKGEKSEAIECYEKALSYGDNEEFLTNLCDLRLSIQ